MDIYLIIPYLYLKKKWQSSLAPNAPALKKLCYLMFYHGFSWKGLRSSNEESHIVKIEKPSEKDARRGSGAAPQGSAGQGGIGLFQAVGYLTGEMKEYRSWLKGGRMSRDEVAGPGQGAYTPPGLDWGSCSLTYPQQVPTFEVLRPQAGSREHNVSYHLNSHDFKIQCISLILALCRCFTPTWSCNHSSNM